MLEAILMALASFSAGVAVTSLIVQLRDRRRQRALAEWQAQFRRGLPALMRDAKARNLA